MVQIFVPTLTTSQVCPWAHPDPSYHSCSRMMWGWSTLKKQKTDQKEEVWQGSFVKCMELTGFYWPRSFPTWITPSESREVIGRTYKEWGNFIPETRWKTFPSREERKKQNALCEGDVNRCATPPSKACTSPINTSPRLPSSGFPHINSSFFWFHPKILRPFNTNNTANSRCPIGRPPQTKSAISHQPHRKFRVFFCLHLLWSVFRQQRHAGKWWHLQLEWPLYSKDCPAGDEHQYNWWRTEFVDLSCPPSISIFPTCIHHPLPSWIRRPNVIQPFWKCDEYTYGFSHHNDSDLPCIKAKKGYASNSSMDIFGSSNRRWEG